ncbi:hypothetical protein AU255_09770 [Methyloprofundus sedimenti]|uniref:Uncharacterized protein n=1 Tax=Methyloprofundus sedimenti TaxID=1420851 RepID=A0A1V8M979_9GAMM|nr:hypothetical protein AU255_09770 [Methyloprofundus sedimenti]
MDTLSLFHYELVGMDLTSFCADRVAVVLGGMGFTIVFYTRECEKISLEIFFMLQFYIEVICQN